MKKLASASFLIVTLAMAAPAVASAAWWNPFSWFQGDAPSAATAPIDTHVQITTPVEPTAPTISAPKTTKETIAKPSATFKKAAVTTTPPSGDVAKTVADLKGTLSTMRVQGEIFRQTSDGSYAGLCDDAGTLKLLGDKGITCHAASASWAASAPISPTSFMCVDSSGLSVLTDQGLADGATACSTATFTSTTNETIVSAKLGETMSVLGVHAKVTDVIEDSRCPSGVQCIQAGTVRVNVHATYGVFSKNVVLTLGQPFELKGHSATLVSVKPDKEDGVPMVPADYVFTFSLE